MSKLQDFEYLIKTEMHRFNLIGAGWTYTFDEAKKRLGQCQYRGKVLSFSLPYIRVNEIEVMHNTVLHEIAHALCPSWVGHGKEWKDMARRVGAKPQRCNDDPRVIKPEGPYVFKCNCGPHYFHRIDALGTGRTCRKFRVTGLVVRTGEVFESATNGKVTIYNGGNKILEALKQASKSTRDIMKELMND